MKLARWGKEVQFSGWSLLAYLLLVSFLCSLGFWQLSRAGQKRDLLDRQQQAANAEALDLNRQAILDGENYRYRQVILAGHYDAVHQLFIDNQMLDGRAGYLVLTPFIPDSGAPAVLVNRGWVPMAVTRAELPDVPIDQPIQQIRGRINHFPSVGIRLAGAEVPGENWPVRVQVIDSRVIADKLGYGLADFQIELDPSMPDGYRRQWTINVLIPPEKHQAYAVQWFGLALTLTALFIWNSSRKKHRG